jgi:hypothetical protein
MNPFERGIKGVSINHVGIAAYPSLYLHPLKKVKYRCQKILAVMPEKRKFAGNNLG